MKTSMTRRWRPRVLWAVGLVALGSVIAVLAWNDVASRPAAVDVRAAAALMETRAGTERPEPEAFPRPQGFAEEIALVLRVQDRVLAAAPVDEGLPMGSGRELSDLVRAGKGLCYDRSRAIETVLALHGLEVRHAAVYSTERTGSALVSLVTPQVSSHAVSEVRTAKGWLLVDSNARWIALTADGAPLSLGALRANPHRDWHGDVPATMNGIFEQPYTWVYGLFSRHGRFYPPYTPVPDVDWSQVPYNLTDRFAS